MWLHESESNSLIRQACENKIFLTIIYISYNSRFFQSASRVGAFKKEKTLVGAFRGHCKTR